MPTTVAARDGRDRAAVGDLFATGATARSAPRGTVQRRMFTTRRGDRGLVDPRELYDLASDLPDLGQPVLVQALTGFADAGAASRLVREHLLDTLESTEVATFDVDQMLDYRARRPIMD